MRTEPSWIIRDLQGAHDYQAALELQRLTWGAHFSELTPASLLKVAQRVGGLAAGAFAHDKLVGLVFGFTGTVNGVPAHWSDLLAVHPDWRNRGIGEALKWHQRAVLLQRGVSQVYWTFDPLESRNAYLNFVRLGATAREYIRDFYGTSDSPLHTDIGTDRLIVDWQLDSVRVAACGESKMPRAQHSAVAPIVNPVRIADGYPHSAAPDLHLTASALRIAIPLDIQGLKTQDCALAGDWRRHTRAAFEHYLSDGYSVQGFIRGPEYGSYLLGRSSV